MLAAFPNHFKDAMKKGRDKQLIAKRDEALIRRYHHWTEIERLRFDDALKVLSKQEFFISEERIMAIIRKNYQKLTDISVKPVPKVKTPKIKKSDIETLFES